eukprot:Hpha_TRINITY_DN3107_c0_g1::TRINITY_DN3107_c0_g1_i1::g.96810::m.96810
MDESVALGLVADAFLAGRSRVALALLRFARQELSKRPDSGWWLSTEQREDSEMLWSWIAGARGALNPEPRQPSPEVLAAEEKLDMAQAEGERRSKALARLLGEKRKEREVQLAPVDPGTVALEGQHMAIDTRLQITSAPPPRPRSADPYPPIQRPIGHVKSRPMVEAPRPPEEVGRIIETITAAPRGARRLELGYDPDDY